MSYLPYLPVGPTYVEHSVPVLDGTSGQVFKPSGVTMDGAGKITGTAIDLIGATWETHLLSDDSIRRSEIGGIQDVFSEIVFSGSGLNDLEIASTVGYPITSPYLAPTTYTITISASNVFCITAWATSGATFVASDPVTQASSGATGTVIYSGSQTIIIQVDSGAFDSGVIVDTNNSGEVTPISHVVADTFDWTDGTNTGTYLPTIVTPQALSNGLNILFPSDTGHNPGDEFEFTASSVYGAVFKANYQARIFQFGSLDGTGNGTRIGIDDDKSRINIFGRQIGIDETGNQYFDSIDRVIFDNSGSPSISAGTHQLIDSANINKFDWENNIWYQHTTDSGTPHPFIDAGAQVFYDGYGNISLAMNEVNARRAYSALGSEVFNWNNTQLNVSLAFRAASTAEFVRAVILDPITRVSSLTLSDQHCSVYGDATTTNVDFTLPSASTANGRIYLITRIDSSGNSVNIIGTVSGVTNPTLAQYDCWIIQSNGTAWYRLN